jgi:hypothetical protein
MGFVEQMLSSLFPDSPPCGAHLLPDLAPAWLPGVGRDEADRLHHPRPFLVVVADAQRLPEMMLLKVRHFMHERRKLCSFLRLRKCDGFSAISSVTSLPSLLPKRPPAKEP